MTITVANTVLASGHTVDYMKSRLNEVADAMTNYVVTTNSNTATGNASITGTFQANTLTANAITSSNGTVVVNSNVAVNATLLTVGSNVSVNASALYIGNSSVNVVINSTSISVNAAPMSFMQTINVATSGLTSQVLDAFPISETRAAEYVITVKNNAGNGHQLSKVLMIFDGSGSLLNDYGLIYSNTELVVFSSDANASHCRLLGTPTINNLQVKGTKITVVI
jgi:hypothetical protein